MKDLICELDYAVWNIRSTLADCFRKLGFYELANDVINHSANIKIFSKYLTIIKFEAQNRKDNDVLNMIASNSLICG